MKINKIYNLVVQFETTGKYFEYFSQLIHLTNNCLDSIKKRNRN